MIFPHIPASGSGTLSCIPRSLRCPLRGFSRGFPRNKSLSPGEYVPMVPALLPRDMELCYRLLRRLVPGLPRGRAASRVEILQHVIDYIRDLQTELDASCPTGDRGTNLHTCQPEVFLKTTEVEESCTDYVLETRG
ncbi:DNA-binding protein inhibitor ID-3-like [Sander vitreus]